MSKKTKTIVGVVTTSALILTMGISAFAFNGISSKAADTTSGNQVSSIQTTSENSTNSFFGRGRGMQGNGGLHGYGKNSRNTMMEKGIMHGDFDSAQLLEQGLITEGQKTAIDGFLVTFEAEKEAERATVLAMTVDERKAYFEEKSTEEHITFFDELAANGIITQEEADAIAAYHQEERQAEMKADLTERLAPLVTDGTFTQAKVDAIITFMANFAGTNRDAATRADRVNPLEQMVTEGVLTQAEADSLAGVMGHGGRGCAGGFRR